MLPNVIGATSVDDFLFFRTLERETVE